MLILNAKFKFMVYLETDNSEIKKPLEFSLPSKDYRIPGIKFKINFNVDKNGKLRTTGTKNEYIGKPVLSGSETIRQKKYSFL